VKPSETASTSKAESTPKNTEDNVEDPDDIPNMQLAWEMLELAKVLYTKYALPICGVIHSGCG